MPCYYQHFDLQRGLFVETNCPADRSDIGLDLDVPALRVFARKCNIQLFAHRVPPSPHV